MKTSSYIICRCLLHVTVLQKKWQKTIHWHLPFVLPWCYKWQWITRLFIFIISLFMLHWHCRWRRKATMFVIVFLFMLPWCYKKQSRLCTLVIIFLLLLVDSKWWWWTLLVIILMSSFSSSFCLVPKTEKKKKRKLKWIKKKHCVFFFVLNEHIFLF